MAALRELSEPLGTTVPVLTEAFHLLSAGSRGAQNLSEFITVGGLGIWFLGIDTLQRCLELMLQYSDRPMDFADASLVAIAEMENTRRIFTLDRNDFDTYGIRRGHRHYPFSVIDPLRR